MKKAIRLDPLPYVYHFMHLGRCYFASGRYEEALVELKKAAELAPENSSTHLLLAVVYGLLDRIEAAQASAQKAVGPNPNLSISFISKAWSYKTKKNLPKVIDAMRKAGFPE